LRAIIQRIVRGSVTVDGDIVAVVGPGLSVFLGVGRGDTEKDATYLAEKITNLRIFADSQGRFGLSALDVEAEVLLVSQFTLYADTRRGRRPSFIDAAVSSDAKLLFEQIAAMLRERGVNVETGCFQQHMQVQLVNDGPVTIIIDSRDRLVPRKR
jgi:D-tyrosyl-tRNA(Tyr) deacylase